MPVPVAAAAAARAAGTRAAGARAAGARASSSQGKISSPKTTKKRPLSLRDLPDSQAEKDPQVKKQKKKGGWLQKIPKEILFSPGGMILFFFALMIEIIDLIPLPFLDQIFELPLEITFLLLFAVIVKPSFKSMVIPFLIERVPIINDILPTWILKMLL